MKFLIPSAKQLSPLTGGQVTALSPESQAVARELADYSVEALRNFYGMKTSQAQGEFERWQTINSGQAEAFPAMDLYDGLMYRQFKPSLSDATQREYARQHLWIATALYGLIPADTLIAPHRLDFSKSLPVSGQPLKRYWQGQYEALIEEEPSCLSLLSSEFEQVVSARVLSRCIKVTFFEEGSHGLKRHSTISKKGRGQLLAYCIQHQIQQLQQLKEACFDGYSFQAHLSKDYDWVFVRERQV